MMLIKRASAALVIATIFGLSTAIAQTTPAPIKAPPKQLPAIEQGALDIVKAMSTKLASAKTLQFQVRVQSEAPSIDNIAVIYTSNSEFTLQRPNKLTAVRTGQGNPSELIYDGQSVAVITPDSNLVAFSKAPGNIDAMAQFIFEQAGMYFPGGMILLSDPYANITSDLRAAFIVEKSKLVGGVETDVVVLAGSGVEGQFWIGSQDKLPYMMTMIYTKEPNRPRVTLEFRDWKINHAVDAKRFSLDNVKDAIKVDFARIDAPLK